MGKACLVPVSSMASQRRSDNVGITLVSRHCDGTLSGAEVVLMRLFQLTASLPRTPTRKAWYDANIDGQFSEAQTTAT